ncbi:hypothetical protein [Archangium sp.]|jgi:hypothetical protein|uniref:hypothetical protein n=1 Tax=Archangium sp. TaxID=1872627 RepID=UPI00389A90A1
MANEPNEATHRISNETNKRLRLRVSEGCELNLAPLEDRREVVLSAEERRGLQVYVQQGYIAFDREASASMGAWPFAAIVSGWFSLAYAVIGLVVRAGPAYWLVGTCGAVGLFCLVVGLLLLLGRSNPSLPLPWSRRLVSAQLGSRRLLSSAMQHLSFLMVVGIAILLPTLLLLSTGLVQRMRGGADVSVELAYRVLHLLFISVLSLLPSLLFFVLDPQCSATLRSKFTRQIFRFDPELTNKLDVRSKYGGLMDEAYGLENPAAGRLLVARRSPVFVATLVITIGWSLTFLSGAPPPKDSDTQGLLAALFAPHKSALVFGFLGSYFYALQTAFRSYVYRDLRPKAYSHITIRIVSTMVLTWVLSLLAGLSPRDGTSPSWLLILAFMTGIVPETTLVLLREAWRDSAPGRKWRKIRVGPSPVDEHEPLTNLDGIDLYDRSRLLDEGVTNVQSLAHHDVVELMLLTRIPVARLLDWVDQAILHLRTPEATGEAKRTGDAAGAHSRLLTSLREYGIRTATDLEKACQSQAQRKQLERLFPSVSSQATEAKAGATESRLPTILRSIRDEHWMRNLHSWHQEHPVEELVLPGAHAHPPRALGGPFREENRPNPEAAGLH